MKILAVCTGNIYRSALTEALLAAELSRLGIDAEVSSAGTAPRVGDTVPADLRRVAAERGWDTHRLAAHRARQLDHTLVAGTDLAIAMTGEHLRTIVVIEPSAFSRTFLLRELARTADERPRANDQSLEEWLVRCHRGRSVPQYLRSNGADDVSDPLGRSSGHLEAVATQIHDAVARLAVALTTR